MAVRKLLSLLGGVAIASAAPGAALAAVPPNDSPRAPAAFAAYTAENGTPRELQAIAELAEATSDGTVPRCMGAASFARTVWYLVPAASVTQEVTVDASGRTLDPVDLAAFVQRPPESLGGAEPAPFEPLARRPNVCSGAGAGGGEAAEDSTSALGLRVPAGRSVLVQAGRRGAASSPDDELAVLSLQTRPLEGFGAPPGDHADARTPVVRLSRTTSVRVSGATITEEDPAQPACPSLGTVWRRVIPGAAGTRLISVWGGGAATLTVFGGRAPADENALDCVNREGRGPLQMRVPVRKGRPLWIQVGVDRPRAGARSALRVEPGEGAMVIDGGPGGFDPTTGGPGGGLPAACSRTRLERARIAGRALRGPAGRFNAFRQVPLAVTVRGALLCDVELRLVGPAGRVYAKGRARRLLGRTVVRLPRLETFRPGRYRLAVTAISAHGRREPVRSRVQGRLG